jgi:hypothetical protein
VTRGVPWWSPDAPPIVAHVHHRPVIILASSVEAGRQWSAQHEALAGQVITEPRHVHGWPDDALWVEVVNPADPLPEWWQKAVAHLRSHHVRLEVGA